MNKIPIGTVPIQTDYGTCLMVFPGGSPDASKLNYLKKYPEVVKVFAEFPQQALSVDIYHDDWCKSMRGIPECDCNPDVTVSDSMGRVIKTI